MRTAYGIVGIATVSLILVAVLVTRDSQLSNQSVISTNEQTPMQEHPAGSSLALESLAFSHNGSIPPRYTCDAENISPPLTFQNVGEAASLVLLMDDPDIPESVKQARGIEVFDHWVVFNIPPTVSAVQEGMEPAGMLGVNGGGTLGYTGPCPPDREHRYIFRLYALDTVLDLSEGATKAEVEAAMEGHVLESAELIGRYERTGQKKEE